jgi:hypothetical protein
VTVKNIGISAKKERILASQTPKGDYDLAFLLLSQILVHNRFNLN